MARIGSWAQAQAQHELVARLTQPQASLDVERRNRLAQFAQPADGARR